MYQKKAEETSYDKFQRSKEESMAIMASNRDATLIVCELLKKLPPVATAEERELLDKKVEADIKKWRKWFYVNLYDTTPDKQMKQEAKEAAGSVPF